MKNINNYLRGILVGICLLLPLQVAADDATANELLTSVSSAMRTLATLNLTASTDALQAAATSCVAVGQGIVSLNVLPNAALNAATASSMVHSAALAVSRMVNGKNATASTNLAALQGAQALAGALATIAASGSLTTEISATCVQASSVLANIVGQLVDAEGVAVELVGAAIDLVDALCSLLNVLAGSSASNASILNQVVSVIDRFATSLDAIASNSTDVAVLARVSQELTPVLALAGAVVGNNAVSKGVIAGLSSTMAMLVRCIKVDFFGSNLANGVVIKALLDSCLGLVAVANAIVVLPEYASIAANKKTVFFSVYSLANTMIQNGVLIDADTAIMAALAADIVSMVAVLTGLAAQWQVSLNAAITTAAQDACDAVIASPTIPNAQAAGAAMGAFASALQQAL